MVQIVHRARVRGTAHHERENVIKSAFSDTGTWIGTVSDIGAVFDPDGVQMGVERPGGEIVDLHGERIGHL
jgi:hypothetical protein